MNFRLEKSEFPRGTDVEGGHTGCQVYIPQPGSELFICVLCVKRICLLLIFEHRSINL